MINVLAYVGMNLQSEVCLWTLLGLIRTIFDATLFRMNANLKQVWQMAMPEQLSMPVQRTLRTMISGVMLVQCFTVYVYLASYIVLLYPVFLEERPALVLPWLLLAAIRKLLCELTSLALGLGTCVLLGPTRPPCIKFVIIKLISIMPSFYTWMLLYSYYHTLKLATAFKTFPASLPNSDPDYGLELAIRRRKTKSLLGEEQLRSKIVATLYGEPSSTREVAVKRSKIGVSSRMIHSTDTSAIDFEDFTESIRPLPTSKQASETGSHEDWVGSEVVVPRDTDRILEQFVLMMLRIGVYLNKEGVQTINSQMFDNKTNSNMRRDNLPCPTLDESETPPQVGSIGGNTASYLREYPQIFMKKSTDISRTECSGTLTDYVQSRLESDEDTKLLRTRKRAVAIFSKEKILDGEKGTVRRKVTSQENDDNEPSTSTDLIERTTQSDHLSIFNNASVDTTNTQQIILPEDEVKLSSSSSTVKVDPVTAESNDNIKVSPSNKQSEEPTKKIKTD